MLKIKRIIALISMTAMMWQIVPAIAFAEDKVESGADTETQENNSELSSVSGYISTSEGRLLAGKGKKTSIYVSNGDYDGVTRAAIDLQEDFNAVTGVEPEIIGTNTQLVEAELESDYSFIESVDLKNGEAKIANAAMLKSEGRGIIAVYDKIGVLKKTVFSENTVSASNDTLNFAPITDILSSDKIKCFVWEDRNNNLTMIPLTVPYDASSEEQKDYDNADVVIGTIGLCDAVDDFIADGRLDVSDIEGKWECFTIQNIEGKTVIAGSDKRGTIYGIYDLSKKIGVSPWEWWADVAPTHEDKLYINLPEGGYTKGEPSVKYRGIFLNDEYNLNQWSYSMGEGDMNAETYEKIFELLLRVNANYLWPAMHSYSTAFNMTEGNAKNADLYGIVMGSSHCEMLLRNNMYEYLDFEKRWENANPGKPLYKGKRGEFPNDGNPYVAYDWVDKNPNTLEKVYNKELIEAYWRERVRENASYENIYTIGMRDIHDGPWNPTMLEGETKVEKLEEIITVQRKILEEEIGKPADQIPQVLIPYKEILDVYNDGLNVPDDVTLMWPDDNYGYIRQSSTQSERERSGRAGVYYHFSLYGYPGSYLWLSNTQPGLIREEMLKAYEQGGDRIWLVNVGDIKPAETEIEYFMTLANDVEGMRDSDITEYLAENAARDFGFNETDAKEYAEIQMKYYELGNARRPEHMESGLFSLTNFGDEAQKRVDCYDDLVSRSEKLYNSLPDSKKAGFFELQLYPLRSCRNMAAVYVYSDKAKLYSSQGRGAAVNKYTQLSKEASVSIKEDTEYYNAMLDGKWNKIMNLEPALLNACERNWPVISVDSPSISALDYTKMGIAVEGQTDLEQEPNINFSKYDREYKFIDLFNKGYGSFDWEISSDKEYIKFNKTSGTVNDEYRLYAGVDYKNAPDGYSEAVITVSRLINGTVAENKQIKVTISNPNTDLREKTFAESNGIVSMEAEHFSRSIVGDGGNDEWRIVKDFGRRGDSVKVYPDTSTVRYTSSTSDMENTKQNSARLEYDVYFETTGKYTVDLYRMPILNELDGFSTGVYVGLDDDDPTALWGVTHFNQSNRGNTPWGRCIMYNSQTLSTTINISEPGYHTIKIYKVDPSFVLDYIVLTNGTKSASYFGAPESYNTTYNNAEPIIPVTEEESQTVGEIEKLYEPYAYVRGVNRSEDNNIVSVDMIKLSSLAEDAVVLAAEYDSNGNMLGVNYTTMNFAEYGTDNIITVNLSLTVHDSNNPISVIVLDSFDQMQIIAPMYEEGTVMSRGNGETKSIAADISENIGKKSVIVIADDEIVTDIKADSIKYIRAEEINDYSYKFIPFENITQGEYNVKLGIWGEEPINETFNTNVNIDTDTEETSETIDMWDFSSAENSNGNIIEFEGDASLDEDELKLSNASYGIASAKYDTPVTITEQGQKIAVEFDVRYGWLSGKYMRYDIRDKNGNSIISNIIKAYNYDVELNVGGTNIEIDDKEYMNLIPYTKNVFTARSYTPVHYKNVIDFQHGMVYLTVSSEKGEKTYSGILDSSYDSIGEVSFSSDYNNNARFCLVDNLSISRIIPAKYKITVKAVDDEQTIIDAKIKITDNIYETEVKTEGDGSYFMSSGVYNITVSAEGYRDIERQINITPSMTSKDISITLNKL